MKLKYITWMLIFYSSDITAQYSDWINYHNGFTVNCSVREADTLWIGTGAGGMVKYIIPTGAQTYYDKTNSGLPQNRIISIAIDTFGNKWIITAFQNGLTKFDGTNWTTYNTSNSGIYADYLQGNILIDDSNNVWVMAWDGYTPNSALIRFDGTNFSAFTGYNYLFYHGCKDTYGNLWYVAPGIIKKYDGSSFTDYTPPHILITSDKISSITADHAGNIWVGFLGYWDEVIPFLYHTGGFAKFDGTTWTEYDLIALGAPTDNVSYLACDNSNNILFLRNPDDHYIGEFDGAGINSYLVNNDSLNYSVSIYVDGLNNKWIGTLWKGLFLNDTNNTWLNIDPSCCPIKANSYLDIEVDKLNNIWVTTNLDSGIAMFDRTNWIAFNKTTTGIAALNRCRYITVDSLNRKWFSSDAGLIMYDDITWTVFDTLNSAIPSDYVGPLAADTAGNIWFSNYDIQSASTIAVKFDGINFQIYNDANTGLIWESIRCIAINSNNVKYFGNDNGMFIYNDSAWVSYDDQNSILPSYPNFTNIAIDGNNNVWTGCYFNWGLFKFDGATWTNYFPTFHVMDVIADSLDYLWFAYKGTAYKFDPSAGIIVDSITMRNSGLPGGTSLHSFAFDQFNNFWFATSGLGIAGYKEGGVILTGQETLNAVKPGTSGLSAVPNPSNEFTEICFSLPYKTNINLSVFDLLGNLQLSINDNFPGAGKHSVRLSTAELAPGVYLVRLNTESETKTIKLVVSSH